MFISDISLHDFTTHKVSQLLIEVGSQTNVLLRNQKLNREEFAQIARTLGVNPKRDLWCEDPDYPELMYVTNKQICANGTRTGLFSSGPLGWHCNGALSLDPEHCVVLYCPETPSIDCKTHFTDGVQAYSQLSSDIKDKIESTEVMLSTPLKSFHKLRHEFFIKKSLQPRLLAEEPVWYKLPPEEVDEIWQIQARHDQRHRSRLATMMTKPKTFGDENGKWNFVYKKLVQGNPNTGHKALYFPISNIVGFHNIPKSEWRELFELLRTQVLKTQQSHQWQQGDFLIFDNRQGLHCRDPLPENDAEGTSQRELWRAAFWYH